MASKPPISKGDDQRINSTNTAASENKESSGSSITDQEGAKKNDKNQEGAKKTDKNQEGAKKNDKKVPETTSEKTPEATDQK
ncbi:hypothetical protein TIFTF001_053133 [Ficus carica]|uniref:Uncharacterized protein n=1 Tax=Ficus carica TaxID=3494 RepID=A0AA88JJ31_FICCA|nr:hypothetical protein TIFTF001_053133 [Ficus carica]